MKTPCIGCGKELDMDMSDGAIGAACEECSADFMASLPPKISAAMAARATAIAGAKTVWQFAMAELQYHREIKDERNWATA